MPSTEPGLNEMCLIPALRNPPIILAAFSVLGMPAANEDVSDLYDGECSLVMATWKFEVL